MARWPSRKSCAADYAATGATPQDTEDMVNYTRSVAGVEVGLFFMEQPAGGIKVSFRSRERIDVAKIAETFGGGGHRLAAGATLMTSLADAQTRVLKRCGGPGLNDGPGFNHVNQTCHHRLGQGRLAQAFPF